MSISKEEHEAQIRKWTDRMLAKYDDNEVMVALVCSLVVVDRHLELAKEMDHEPALIPLRHIRASLVHSIELVKKWTAPRAHIN